MSDAEAGLEEGVLEAYEGFAERVTPFSEAASHRADVQCARGCSSCCVAGLSVCGVEASRVRRALTELGSSVRRKVRAQAADATREQCVFLVDDACAVYDARPMVCRTQGLPLAYDEGTIPAERLSARAADGRDLTWCPLNYTAGPPAATEIVDAMVIDRGVATLNRAFASVAEEDPMARVSLSELARSEAGPR